MLCKIKSLFKKNEVKVKEELPKVVKQESKNLLQSEHIQIELAKLIKDRGLTSEKGWFMVSVVEGEFNIKKTRYSFDSLIPKLYGNTVKVEAEEMDDIVGDMTISLIVANGNTEEQEKIKLKFANVKLSDAKSYSKELTVSLFELYDIE